MSVSKKNAICGLCAALSITVLLLLNVLTVVSYCIAMAACIPLVFCFIECGKGRAVAVYTATSLLSLLFVPNLADLLLYIATYAVISLVKIPTDTIKNKALKWTVKVLVYLACDGVYYALTLLVFNLPIFEEFSLLILGFSLLMGVILGIIYDVILSQAIYIYFKHYRKYVMKFLK